MPSEPRLIYWKQCSDCGYETFAHSRVACPDCGTTMAPQEVAGAVVEEVDDAE